MRIGFFANTYPAPSATFIRRKIQGLEDLGVTVCRLSSRSFGGELVEPADQLEAGKTDVLTAHRRGIVQSVATQTLRHPRAVLGGARQALKLSAGPRELVRHGAYLAIAQRLATRVRVQRLEHLHAYFDTSTTVALLAHRITGIPFSFTVTGPEQFEPCQHDRLAEQIRGARFVTAVSEDGLRNLRAIADPRDHPKLHLVRDIAEPTWLDTPVTPIPTTRSVCFVGRLVDRKGPLDLIEAVHRVHQRGRDLSLAMVGDGPLRGAALELIARHGLHEHVTLLGWGSAQLVRRTIEASTSLVLPSSAEGLPMVLMEAFARGRPVITTPVAGIPELVEAGRSGWLVPPKDPAALSDAIEELLDCSNEMLTGMARVGCERTRAQHSIGPLSEQLLGLLRASV